MRLYTLFIFVLICPALHSFSQAKKKSVPQTPAELEKEMLKEYINHMKIKDDSAARKTITAKPDSFRFTPKYVYLQQVELFPELKDDSAGFTLQPKTGKSIPVTLEKGTAAFFNNYLTATIHKTDSLYPVVLKIKKLNITETRADIIYDNCKLSFEYVFECRYKNKIIPLTSYTGEFTMHLLLGMRKAYDSLIQETLHDVFPKIDGMMEEAIDKIPDLCKGVNHKVSFRNNEANNDTLFFNGQSPLLSWSDYTGVTANENQFASYSGIYFAPEFEYKHGYLNILTRVGTCFIKSQSLAGDNVRREEVLRHENYRMKLVHCYALQLKRQLEELPLTMDNYKEELSKVFNTVNASMKAAEETYNNETMFGLKKKEQQRWEEGIHEKLVASSQ